ncbi:hypothetical protein [Pseudomonas prosekii]|uniref:Uncharacterized protein n=1 Tax=Pseudomonas prosekii TaxID=1148509 RepID=A0A1H1S725_9PSED|nr:hypothetical protein [Pseudomonas prosekii]SDS43910.1 hypothetical protein SAMN05216222_1455 [Pseudomonas prosekii]
MPLIMITSAITTVFEVPEGVDIFRVRQLALSELGDDERATDDVSAQHDNVMSGIYLGSAERRTVSISHCIADPTE